MILLSVSRKSLRAFLNRIVSIRSEYVRPAHASLRRKLLVLALAISAISASAGRLSLASARRRTANRLSVFGRRLQGYLNLKGYGEFAAENRPAGWNTRLTFSISPRRPRPG